MFPSSNSMIWMTMGIPVITVFFVSQVPGHQIFPSPLHGGCRAQCVNPMWHGFTNFSSHWWQKVLVIIYIPK